MELALICILVIAAATWYCTRGVKSGVMHSSSFDTPPEPGTGIPEGKETDYAAGIDPGGDGIPVMYTLTTCRHCVHLKNFLEEHHIGHHLVYVDDFSGPARSSMMNVLRAHNPRGSFPTLVLPGGETIVGFRRKEVCEAFGLPL